MTIWILTVLLLASLAGLGLRQGAIRVAFSFAGILLGALLATPLAPLLGRGLAAVGLKSDTLLWLVPPVVVFVVVQIVFKVAALAVHRKVAVHYKYKAGDLRLALWERLNSRLGLCLGVANGAAYLILISFVIYISSYWSVQVATADAVPRGLKLLNRMGADLEATGMARVGRAIDRMPDTYYETADLAGLLYLNPLLEGRLFRYPPFLGLAEQPDFQAILNDKDFTQMWQKPAPITELIRYPSVAAILKNRPVLNSIRAIFEPELRDNLEDLRVYLTSGASPKYDSNKVLGRWDFDVRTTLSLLRKSRPTIASSEMARLRRYLAQGFAGTTLVAMTDRRAVLKNYPHVKITAGAAPTTEMETIEGQWKKSDEKYALNYTFDGKTEEHAVEVEGDRLVIVGQGLDLAFQRED